MRRAARFQIEGTPLGETRTVSVAVPVVRDNWYAIWGDVHQGACAGGIADSVSNFTAYVGPISYFQV